MTPIDEVPDAYDSEDDSELDEEFDSEDDEEDEDISESDLIAAEAEEDSEEEEDDLDEIDARISALEEAEASSKKSKKRRASAGDDDLDAVMDDAAAEEEAPKKLSKKDRKKLKAANGEAVAAPATSSSAATAASEDSEDSAKKSVSFSNDTKPAAKLVSGGLSIEDRKQGEGPSVKHGAKVAIRYVGKLKSNGKQFDANSKGKPFTFSVGKGEVIKGMELGVVGMKAGGERRVTIPAAMAYGKKSLPGIPANSDLVFDIKLLKF
jgi:FK506-binding nuclear protein